MNRLIKALRERGWHPEVGFDNEGHELHIWRPTKGAKVVYGMYPTLGDKNPYILNLEEVGFHDKPKSLRS